MPPEYPEKDLVRLLHMRDAAREALAFAKGRRRQDLDEDRMLFRATVNCIQEIGEAAARVTEPTRSNLPQIPWHRIVSMRNRLVHGYFAINPDFVWQVLEHELLPLLAQLEPILPESI